MLANVKSKFEKTKQFVLNNPTAVACTATFVVAWKMSHDVTLAGVLEQTANMSHEYGRYHGILEFQNGVLLTFIENKELMPEFTTFYEAKK